MIRRFKDTDLEMIMQIWLSSNTQVHNFISKEYWTNNYEMVKELIPQSEIYVYENICSNVIEAFIGMNENYIAGIFVNDKSRSKGIGKKLLDYIKNIKPELTLCVYQKNKRAVNFYLRENFKIQSQYTDEDTEEIEFNMIWNK